MIDYKIIGERLKEARKTKGVTQDKLCKELGFSVAFLSRIERGSSEISLKRLSQICDILGVSEGLILNGTNKDTDEYLTIDLKKILDKCNKEQKKLIYEVAKTIIEN